MRTFVCTICGNTNNNIGYTVKEMMFGIGDVFTYFECSECGCLQISEPPACMEKYYPPEYHSFSAIPQSKNFLISTMRNFIERKRNEYALFDNSLVGRIAYRKFPDVSLRLLSWIKLSKDAKILDVGCGSGSILNSLKRCGFKNLFGIDKFIKKDIAYENGLSIKKMDLNEVEGAWDLVMFHHSLEHMPNQLDTLQKTSQLLTTSGVCLVNVPIVNYAWQVYRTNWVQLDAPRHFYLHSIKSLTMLAKKANLDLKNIVYNSSAFQFWGSELYNKGMSTSKYSPYSVFSKSELKKFEDSAKALNTTNQGDTAAFYFLKNIHVETKVDAKK